MSKAQTKADFERIVHDVRKALGIEEDGNLYGEIARLKGLDKAGGGFDVQTEGGQVVVKGSYELRIPVAAGALNVDTLTGMVRDAAASVISEDTIAAVRGAMQDVVVKGDAA